jgi:glutathionylspermidine amidase/synthetase
MPNKLPTEHMEFGLLLGRDATGIEVFSSDYATARKKDYPTRESYQNFIDGVYMGYKWQCVELARRWLYINKGYVFDDVAMAYDIFRLKHVRRLSDDALLPLHSFKNGSKRPPEVGALLIWDEGGEFHVTGHVAIVTEVDDTHVRFIEQNVENNQWPAGQNYSRELHIEYLEDGGYCLNCSFDDATILGWVIQTNDPTHSEIHHDADPHLFNIQMAEIPTKLETTEAWLDTSEPDIKAYVQMMGGAKLASEPEDFYKYFRLSTTCLNELKRATNEMHAMIMHATGYVLKDDALLKKFNLPEILWPKIRQSWNNRQNQIITGRMDFAVSERGIKLYEYNADSASCHMETGKIQGLWGKAVHCTDGVCSGEKLGALLVEAWKNSEIEDDLLHIMLDHNLEETYHALWMRSLIEKAGIKTKVIKGIQNLKRNGTGQIVDEDNNPIKWVWKTWAWETALDEVRAQCDEIASSGTTEIDRPIGLADVFLHEDVMVFEPLWTLIPSNKAILPILKMMHPKNPFLLDSQFSLTPSLQESGYVSKPIVGRCGANISLVDKNSNLLKESSGEFEDRDQIFQELWKLPNIAGRNVQVGTFTAGGRFGGASVRTDQSLIITSKSDILPLRICEDDTFSS